MLFGLCAPMKYYLDLSHIGYDYIELSGRELSSLSDADFRDFLSLYQKTGFPCLALNDFCGSRLVLAGPGYDLLVLKDYVHTLLERSSLLGIRSIAVGAPASRRLPDHFPVKLAEIQFCRFLSMASQEAAPYHIEFLLEALHSGVCNYINHTGEAVSIVKKLQKPNLALVLDYYHAWNMGESPEDISSAMPFVRHLHISSLSQPGARDFIQAADIPLLRSFLTHAKQCGYQGTFSTEPSPMLFHLENAIKNLSFFRQADT